MTDGGLIEMQNDSDAVTPSSWLARRTDLVQRLVPSTLLRSFGGVVSSSDPARGPRTRSEIEVVEVSSESCLGCQ